MHEFPYTFILLETTRFTYICNWTEIYIFVVRVVQNLRKMTNMRR